MSTNKGKGSVHHDYACESFVHVKLSANKLLLRGKPIPYFIKYKTKVFKVIFIYKKKTLLKYINIVNVWALSPQLLLVDSNSYKLGQKTHT